MAGPGSLLLFSLFLGLFISIYANSLLFKSNTDGRTINSIPNPMIEPYACGRENIPKSSVCDPDHILTKDDKNEIEGYINKVTTAQIAVAVIDKMSLSEVFTNDKTIASEKFARKLHDKWGVGSAEKNDGILIFLSISDRLTYISTGSGVQHKLNYDAIQAVIQHMRGFLRKQQYGRAVGNAIIQIDLLLSGQKSEILEAYSAKKSSSGESSSEFYITVGVFLFFIVVMGYMSHRSSRRMDRCQKGKEMLNKLMKAVDEDGKTQGGDGNSTGSNTYLTSSCPICLEDFPPVDRRANVEYANKIPMALQCGHVFCKGCLEEYLLNDGCKCPICRAPVDNVSPPNDTFSRRAWRRVFPTRIPSPPENTGYTRSANIIGETRTTFGSATQTMTMDPGYSSAFTRNTPEFRFRLHRMRSLYPDIMTLEMLRSMDRALDSRSPYDFRTELDAQAMQLQRTIEDIRKASEISARGNGMSGSRRSFGGGRSSGGGGGSW
jgi:uncharacterized membrane protein YgcG